MQLPLWPKTPIGGFVWIAVVLVAVVIGALVSVDADCDGLCLGRFESIVFAAVVLGWAFALWIEWERRSR